MAGVVLDRRLAPQELQNLSSGSFSVPQRGKTRGQAINRPPRRPEPFGELDWATMGRKTNLAPFRIGIGILVIALVAVVLVAVSGGDDPPEPQAVVPAAESASEVDSGAAPQPSQAGGRGSDEASGKGSTDGGSAVAAEDSAGRPAKPPADEGETASAPVAAPAESCPPEIPRAQCEAFAEAAADPGRSVAVSKPSDCLKVMSRADCREMFEEMKAAQEQAGESFRPEDCLDHMSREQCKDYFDSMRQASQ